MNKLLTIVFLMCATAAFAEPKPPTAEMVSEWVSFSRPVHLLAKKEDISRGDTALLGEAVWLYSYSANKETPVVYAIGLYKVGTLFGKNRAEMEKSIPEQAAKMKLLAARLEQMKDPRRTGADPIAGNMAKSISVETRADGRKVYFTVMGFGPGGQTSGGFTTVAGYDALIQQFIGFEGDARLKDPPQPTKNLQEVFMQLERHILTSK